MLQLQAAQQAQLAEALRAAVVNGGRSETQTGATGADGSGPMAGAGAAAQEPPAGGRGRTYAGGSTPMPAADSAAAAAAEAVRAAGGLPEQQQQAFELGARLEEALAAASAAAATAAAASAQASNLAVDGQYVATGEAYDRGDEIANAGDGFGTGSLAAAVQAARMAQVEGVVAAANRGAAVDMPKLTRRERSVLELVGEGLLNKEIAATLGVVLRYVEKNVQKLLEKTGTTNRTALVKRALQLGLISLEPNTAAPTAGVFVTDPPGYKRTQQRLPPGRVPLPRDQANLARPTEGQS